jgi:hypothetical protein
MYMQLRDRYESGHAFDIFDHNKLYMRGVIKTFEFEEIVATVPSDYKGSMTIIGFGEPPEEDYYYYEE